MSDNLTSLATTNHNHKVIDSDLIFKVDAFSREITSENPQKELLIQGDHRCERFSFEIPRYIEGHDMYLCNSVQVYFINMEDKKRDNKHITGVYTLDDLHIATEDSDKLIGSWLISGNATKFAGVLQFMLVFSCVDGIKVNYKWCTKIFDHIKIVESLDSDLSFESDYSDVIEQWKAFLKVELKDYIKDVVADDVATAKDEVSADFTARADAFEAGVNEQLDAFDDILEKEITTMDGEIDVLKARMDTFTSLPEGATTDDAALADIKVGADGVLYETPAEAVREQINKTKKYFDNVMNGIIDPCGIQVLDFGKIKQGYSIDIYTGASVESSEEYYAIDYLMLVDRTKSHYMAYDKETRTYLYFHDQEGNYLSHVYIEKSGSLEEFPENTKYVKIVFIRNGADDDVALRSIKLLEGSDKPYSDLILAGGIVKPINCSFFISNLLKYDELEYNMVFNPSYGNVYESGDLERTVTGFIDVSELSNITTNFAFYIAYYDINKTFINDLADGLKHEAGTLPIPSNDQLKYARLLLITTNEELISTYYISNCSYPYTGNRILMPENLPSEYSELPTRIDDLEAQLNTNWYTGKKITVFGDSITEGNKWQPYVADIFDCIMVNCGIGGTTVANNGNVRTYNGTEIESWMCSDDRINLIPEDSDMIIIFGGANDWAQSNIDMGVLGDGNLIDSTFKSAYSLIIKKLVDKFPNAKLAALTLINGRTSAENVNEDKQHVVRGFTLYDFSVAIKEVCMYYGIPCIDIHGESGINTFNHTTYIADIVHPNNEGGKKIANAVINGLKRFEPIDL